MRNPREAKESEVRAKVEEPHRGGQGGDSHAISLLSIPLPPPLARGLAVPLQTLLVNLLPLLLPAQVLGPLSARHGERHVPGAAQAGPAALPPTDGQSGLRPPLSPLHPLPEASKAPRQSPWLTVTGGGDRVETKAVSAHMPPQRGHPRPFSILLPLTWLGCSHLPNIQHYLTSYYMATDLAPPPKTAASPGQVPSKHQ